MDESGSSSRVTEVAEFFEQRNVTYARNASKAVTLRLDMMNYAFLQALAKKYEVSPTKLGTMLLEAAIRDLVARYPGMLPLGFTIGRGPDGQATLVPGDEFLEMVAAEEEELVERAIARHEAGL